MRAKKYKNPTSIMAKNFIWYFGHNSENLTHKNRQEPILRKIFGQNLRIKSNLVKLQLITMTLHTYVYGFNIH
jgi:hypothetical protein